MSTHKRLVISSRSLETIKLSKWDNQNIGRLSKALDILRPIKITVVLPTLIVYFRLEICFSQIRAGGHRDGKIIMGNGSQNLSLPRLLNLTIITLKNPLLNTFIEYNIINRNVFLVNLI